MRKFVLTVAALALFASPALAQVGSPGVFQDQGGLSCNITVPVFSPFAMYVVHKSPTGATGAQWKLKDPTTATFFFNGGSVASGSMLSIGEPLSGVAIAYGACLVGDNHVYTLNFFASAAVPNCTYIELIPDPTVLQGTVIVTDCALIEYSVNPGEGIMNADGTCDCNVAVEETTWSRVKSLYR